MAVNNCINNQGDSLTAVTNGLTVTLGATTLTPIAAVSSGIVKISNTGVLSTLEDSVATDGQVLISANAGVPAWASLTAGENIIITPGANSITIAASGGLSFSEETGDKTIVVNEGYIANKAVTALAFALPAASAVGDVFAIVGNGATMWTVSQAANQYIHLGNAVTTVGVAGGLAATHAKDCIEAVCIEADKGWVIRSAIGNITLN